LTKIKFKIEFFFYPCSYHHLKNSNWWLQESKRITKWTLEENKLFENALALYDKDTPDRWMMVAEMIPSKTISDVMKHYRDHEEEVSVIESGLIPFPMYTTTSSITLEMGLKIKTLMSSTNFIVSMENLITICKRSQLVSRGCS
jgi:hypothetical protein